MSSRVIHFEVPVDDFSRACDFYQSVFDWKIEKWEGPEDYYLISTGPRETPGIDGALTGRSELTAHTTNTVDVASLEASLERVQANGGKVLTPTMAIPGVGRMAYCQDTEGNVFGMMQSDPSAQ
jgi:uncharacterized protein